MGSMSYVAAVFLILVRVKALTAAVKEAKTTRGCQAVLKCGGKTEG